MSDEFETSFLDDLSLILDNARLRDVAAESTLHREFVDKLVTLASQRINDRFRSKIAPEEVVQSVFASFFRRHRKGEFEFEDWNDLWALLVKITVCKCVNRIKQLTTAKRDVRREISGESNSIGTGLFFRDLQPSAVDIAIFNESLDQLFDQLPDNLQAIVCFRLQGMSNLEISEKMDCSERTVYRSLQRIRKIFSEMDDS